MNPEKQKHTISPIFSENSKILILGSFPSVKSREVGFFYGHPQNRFWKVLSKLFESTLPITVEEKKALLINNRVALWDVVESCTVEGSSDLSIKNVVPNDIARILTLSEITAVFTNGKTASDLYRKYVMPSIELEDIRLPSTSPANAPFGFDKLCDNWKIILDFLK